MNKAFFITGTDTEIGKTHATCALLSSASHIGLRAAGLKPIAAGTDASGKNDDVARLMTYSNVSLAERTINPWLLKAPVSPHIAANLESIEITLEPILNAFKIAQQVSDIIFVEGVGGLYAPISDTLTQPDLIKALDIPVILTIGLKLGCLNHALLTAEAIKCHGLRFAGWIGNRIDPAFDAEHANIKTLEKSLDAPCLGILPYLSDVNPDTLSRYLVIP